MRIKEEGRNLLRVAWRMAGVAAWVGIVIAAVAMGAPSGRNQVTVQAQSAGTATAHCQRGTSAVAGGFAAPDFHPGSDGGGVARFSSKLVGKREVETSGFNFGLQSGKLVSLAYCATNAHGFDVRSHKGYIAAGGVDATVARCPVGTKVVGGGFGTPGFAELDGPRVIALTSRPVGKRRWRVEAFNTSDPSTGRGPGAVLAYAYCETDPPDLVKVVKQARLPVGQALTVDVDCPGGSRAYSGGFDGNISLTTEASAAAAVTSKKANHGRSWRLKVFDVSDTRHGRVTGFALCREA
jgi:hypothetical protein